MKNEAMKIMPFLSSSFELRNSKFFCPEIHLA